jgi:hypothetical protein
MKQERRGYRAACRRRCGNVGPFQIVCGPQRRHPRASAQNLDGTPPTGTVIPIYEELQRLFFRFRLKRHSGRSKLHFRPNRPSGNALRNDNYTPLPLASRIWQKHVRFHCPFRRLALVSLAGSATSRVGVTFCVRAPGRVAQFCSPERRKNRQAWRNFRNIIHLEEFQENPAIVSAALWYCSCSSASVVAWCCSPFSRF